MRSFDPNASAVCPHVDKRPRATLEQEVVAIPAHVRPFDDQFARVPNVEGRIKVPRTRRVVDEGLAGLVERVDRPIITVFGETRLPDLGQGRASSSLQIPVFFILMCYKMSIKQA